MIYLYSGLPGTGKSLFTINDVINASENFKTEEGLSRQVYFYNITFLNDHDKYSTVENWIQLDQSDLLQNLPLLLDDKHPVIKQGSIILVDECQDIYPTRRSGEAPNWITFFEKHRHTGCDFFLITQNTSQMDAHLRRLVGEHHDLKRVLGRDLVSDSVLGRVQEGKDKDSEEAIKNKRTYPKSLFGLYKSAVIHTHKKPLPAKIKYVLPITFILVIYLSYSAITGLNSIADSDSQDIKSNTEQSKSIKQLPKVSSTIFVTGEIIYKGRIKTFFEILIDSKEEKSFLSLTEIELQNLGYSIKRVTELIYLVDDVLVTRKPLPQYPADYHIDSNNEDNSTQSNNSNATSSLL